MSITKVAAVAAVPSWVQAVWAVITATFAAAYQTDPRYLVFFTFLLAMELVVGLRINGWSYGKEWIGRVWRYAVGILAIQGFLNLFVPSADLVIVLYGGVTLAQVNHIVDQLGEKSPILAVWKSIKDKVREMIYGVIDVSRYLDDHKNDPPRD